MNSKKRILKTAFTLGFSFVFAVFFMWLALGNLDFHKVKASLARVDYFWVLVSAFLGILAYGFRAVRWNLLLEPMGYKIKNANAFWTIAFGYMMNLTIPRSGELARATALYGVEQIPVEKSFATIVVERIVDFCFMLFFLLLTFVFNTKTLFSFYERMTNYGSDEQKEISGIDAFLLDMGVENIGQFYNVLKLILLLLVVLGLAWGFLRFKEKLVRFFKGMAEGIWSVFKMKERFKFLFYSAGIWFCYFLSAYCICFSLAETADLGVGDVFLIITAGTLGMMVPTSGGAGSYHIAVKLAISGIFVALGRGQKLGEEVGLTYALVSHTMQVVCMLIMGLIAIPALWWRKGKI